MSLFKDFLQGKWLGHPLHPAIVHVPTGLFPAALLFDLMARTGDDSDVLGRCAFWAITVGLIAALVAAPTGLADWWDIKRGKPAHKLGLVHMSINVVVLVLMAASLYLRRQDISFDDDVVAPVPAAAIITNALGNLMLAVSGYLGGRMVFDRGVGVARLSKKKWQSIARAGRARVPVD
jgi:uncharacterized membrane protein